MVPGDRWEVLSGWLSAWIEGDAPTRERLRERLTTDHPELIADADRLAVSARYLRGFLETPAIVLEARELAVDDPGLPTGALVGPYRVISLIARGGMGDVYRATDTRLHRDVAVKVLAQTKTGDPLRVERFMQEARITASLDHSNIVRVYDVGRVDDRAYLVAELLEGETLRARIARGPVAPEEARRIALDVARGLAAAHDAGLVHRDLKPENVFLTHTGEAKLLDFGIAKLTQDESVPDGFSTLTGVVLGTAGYLAPEQIRGEIVDPRADLFAFGAVLFEMLTGTRAFVREHIVETLHAILHDPPSSALEQRTSVPPELAAIAMRLLEKAPQARFQSAVDLIVALEQADLESRRSWLQREAGRWRSGRRARRRWGAAATLAAAVLALSIWLARPAPGITLAILPFQTVPVDDGMFALGLAEVFSGRLGQLPGVTVVPLSASERQPADDPIKAGVALGATHVFWGSILRDGSALQATAHLTSTSTGRDVRIPVPLAASSIFTLQDLIANRVIEELTPNLEAAMRMRLKRAGTGNDQAWDLYVLARGQVTRPTPQALQIAAQTFRKVVEIDPNFADAWAYLGSAFKRMSVVADAEPGKVFPEARKAAEQALAIEANHPEATSVLGTVAFWYDWNYERAIELLKDALARQPSADTRLFLAHVYSNTGLPDDAVREIRIAGARDPGWLIPRALEGEFQLHGGKFDVALTQLEDVIETESRSSATMRPLWLPHLFRAFALIAKRRYEDAIAACDMVIKLRQGPPSAPPTPHYSYAVALKGYAFARLGKTSEAVAMLDELQAQEAAQVYVPPSRKALLLHALGRDDEAFAQLRKAVEVRDVLVTFLGVSPLWDDLRGTRAFQEVLKQANLFEVSESVRATRRR